MNLIKLEQPFENSLKFQLSSFAAEMECFCINDNFDQDLLFQSLSPSHNWGFFYSPQSWITVNLNRRTYFLPQGNMLLVKPGETLLSDSNSKKGGPSYYLTIRALSDNILMERNLGFTSSELSYLYQCFEKKASPVLDISSDMNRFLEEIKDLCLNGAGSSADDLINLRLKNLFRQVWIILAEGKDIISNALDSRIDSLLPRLPRGGYSLLVENAINQMGDDFDENITLVNLAKTANISLSRFKVRFAQETGISPLEYFTRLSIQKAMFLLHDTEKTIFQIAMDLGYSSAGHFSTLFKNTAGLTPGEFRRWLEGAKKSL